MLITCDNHMQMGYIYLMPNDSIEEYTLDKSEIGLFYDVSSLSIPRIKWNSMGQSLSQMRLATKTYREAVDKAFHCEFWNDLDQEGYMMGIELYLTEDMFLTLVAHQAFKLYDTRWRNQDFRVLTLDAYHDVFNKNNIIYPLTAAKDVFVILAIDPSTKISKIMALISSRDDLYPIDYLRNPLFMLANSSRYYNENESLGMT
ncbi:hypothetical protein [Desulfosporosinus meridiei]|uniref:Uncharacterized protein n=1 Tax=Desulfosporosinus meridiei (strain ATCC BAA-275 / DSM 13257 / KCTC 12902 / NCIMB 13706 / S10) TaxID=768704 RepID=J7J1Z4_DESMD|nr:hypothetical protein [Desulfosporosinus meridiei]AFQ44991.1 hypothetical protein Desmer_3109 [Desulfosporosinus meridiei DSM 13257]